jgi:hypothetical protein
MAIKTFKIDFQKFSTEPAWIRVFLDYKRYSPFQRMKKKRGKPVNQKESERGFNP